MDFKINFCIQFCSRYTYPEVCEAKNHEKQICFPLTVVCPTPLCQTSALFASPIAMPPGEGGGGPPSPEQY